jgi:hypothetical protein
VQPQNFNARIFENLRLHLAAPSAGWSGDCDLVMQASKKGRRAKAWAHASVMPPDFTGGLQCFYRSVQEVVRGVVTGVLQGCNRVFTGVWGAGDE